MECWLLPRNLHNPFYNLENIQERFARSVRNIAVIPRDRRQDANMWNFYVGIFGNGHLPSDLFVVPDSC